MIKINSPQIIKFIHWAVNKYGIKKWMFFISKYFTAKDSLILAIKGSNLESLEDLEWMNKEGLI